MAAEVLGIPLLLRDVDEWLTQQEAAALTAAGERYAWATGLAKRYRLRSFAAAFAKSVGRLPKENAAGLLQHVTEQALLHLQ